MVQGKFRVHEFLGAVVWLVAALVTAAMAISVPIHFQAVAPAVLGAAGRGTPQADELARTYLNLGMLGPAGVIEEGTPEFRFSGTERAAAANLVERNPRLRLSGGPSPYYDEFLSAIRADSDHQDTSVVARLISAQNREELLGFLAESQRIDVQTVLNTRELTTVTRFPPINSAAGQPYEAALLMTALLLQSDRLDLTMASGITQAAASALEGSRLAVDDMEDIYIEILTLGRRLDWVQMSELARSLGTADQMVYGATLLRLYPDYLPQIYAALMLGADPVALGSYLRDQGENAWPALDEGLRSGAGALAVLVERNQPLYQTPGRLTWVDRYLSPPDSPLLDLSARQPGLAVALKGTLFLLSGLFAALLVGCVARALTSHRSRLPLWHPLSQTRRYLGALILGGSLWVFVEPAVLESSPQSARSLKLDFIDVNRLEALQSQNIVASLMERTTIYVLVVFFAIQFVIYLVCLIKLAEIRRGKGTPDFKIKLLENEDALFDLGVYVGLGGTVTSLILLAAGVEQASLVAAYASTLFGILFVGALKVIHVRPYRRVLLLQREHESRHSSVDTEKDTNSEPTPVPELSADEPNSAATTR